MIYPDEHTEGNRVFTADAWLYIYNQLRALGLRINCLGAKASVALRPFYEEATFDAEYPPSISGMKECIARSSLAVGASTGPTWALLFSDIPQIVLFGRKSCHWDFDRIETIVAKRLHVFPTFASVASPLLGPGARLSPDLRRQVGEPGIRVAHSEFSSKHPHHPTPEVHLFDCRVGNLYEKWAASSGDGAWAEFIFERPTLLREVCVFHAGILEGPETNTRDYDISVWDEHAWVKAARVRANTDAVTRHPVSPILTDRVRLDVLKAGSDGGVRIYEIKFLE
jgi:hypothetical protein